MSFLGYAALLLCWMHCAAQRGEAGICGRPPAIQNGDFLGLAKKKYQQGDTVEYQCQNFYILEGSPTITCSNGQWTSPPVCLVPCTASQEDMDRNNIQLRWDPTKKKLYVVSGDTIEFDCKPGYFKDPSTPNFKVQCVEGTLEYPRCTRGRSCALDRNTVERNHIQLESSRSSSPSYHSGDDIYFKCEDAFSPVSPTDTLRAQCLDGVITYPVCQVPCTASQEDMDRNNIQLRWDPKKPKLYSTSGDTIEFDCKLGYIKDPSTPNFRVQCVEGTLKYPRCTRGRSCFLDRNTMKRNHIQLQSSRPSSRFYHSGDDIYFECKRWYRQLSESSRFRAQCLDGVITYPVCQVPCTASQEDMDRNNIQLRWDPKKPKLYSTSGDTIEFDCKLGYIKDPSTPNFRVQCVEGTLKYPRCTRGRSCALDRNTMKRNHIQLQSSRPSSRFYHSGDDIYFECKRWYRQLSESSRFRAQCLDGVITYPVCQDWFDVAAQVAEIEPSAPENVEYWEEIEEEMDSPSYLQPPYYY